MFDIVVYQINMKYNLNQISAAYRRNMIVT